MQEPELHGLVDRTAKKVAQRMLKEELEALQDKKLLAVKQIKNSKEHDDWVFALGAIAAYIYAAITYMSLDKLAPMPWHFFLLMCAVIVFILIVVRLVFKSHVNLRGVMVIAEEGHDLPEGFVSIIDLLDSKFARGILIIGAACLVNMVAITLSSVGLSKMFAFSIVLLSWVLLAIGALEIESTMSRPPRFFLRGYLRIASAFKRA